MSEKNKNKIVTIVFAIIIILSFFINIIKKDEIISIAERRKLEQFPSVSISQIINGTFFNKFDKYVTDQFFKREVFRKIKINTELKLLNKKDYNNLYEYNNYIVEEIYPLNEKSILNISNKIVESFITHQAFKKIIILESFTPLSESTLVNGKAAYIGPAAKDAINIDKATPTIPDSFPIYFIIDSRDIHTSIRPSIIIIGGRTDSIWATLDLIFEKIFSPKLLLKI